MNLASGLLETKFIRVVLPYAVFGIEARDGKVVEAAPIAHWMIGKDTALVRAWIAKKGGTHEVLLIKEEE